MRGQGHSPKQIARTLGLTPAAVTPLIRAVAAQVQAANAETLPGLVGCWINRGWSAGLSYPADRGWLDENPGDGGTGGLAAVLLARTHGWDKLAVSGYLVDTYCLGVKNATGPDIQTEMELRQFRAHYFSSYAQGWQDAPHDLAGTWSSAARPTPTVWDSNRTRTSPPVQPSWIPGLALRRSLSARTADRSTAPPWSRPPSTVRVGKGNYDFVLGAPELGTFDRLG